MFWLQMHKLTCVDLVICVCVVLHARFGEDDATLQLEEKMWARMQKDRNQRSRSGGIFNLGDDSGPSEVLTHRGQALGTNDEDGVGAQDDEDDDLDAEVVDQLHFGGDGSGDAHATYPQVRSSRDRVAYDCALLHGVFPVIP